jgi:hypothetical protein
MIVDRTKKLRAKPLEVSVDDIPFDKMSKEEFDENWLFRQLTIRGIFDHSQET